MLFLTSVLSTNIEGRQNETLYPSINIVSVNHDSLITQNLAEFTNTISEMLQLSGYPHDPSKISLHKAQKNFLAIVETEQGKKFIKIKKRGAGYNEYVGTLLFKDFAPIITTEKLILSENIELVIQPFNPSTHLLYHKIAELEAGDQPATWELIHSIFFEALKLSCQTMHYSVANAKNDEFFFNRLKTKAKEGLSGRIEKIYTGKTFRLMNCALPWEELKALKWNIDGVNYKETLAELLANSHDDLDINRERLIGISHGNWHENNILVNHEKPNYAYFALEFAGENDLIGDAMMFLTHATVYADYLNPVYYSKAYGNEQMEDVPLENVLLMKQRDITLSKTRETITLNGVGSFGTLPSRKKVAHLFYEKYFAPLINQATRRFGHHILTELDNHSKAALLLRLLGGQDVTKMTPHDQVKIISLIYKSIGTPSTEAKKELTIDRFMNAL